MNRLGARGDDGFTLVELVIALLILAIVMTAFGPTFIGMMRASAATDQRSVADGLAVAASENVRALPYYDVGYSSTHGTPAYCTGSSPVQTDVVGPMDAMPTQQTVQNIKYTIQSCAYWVSASDTSTQAYKESVVTVLWGTQNQYKYVQSSAIYPGGETKYANTGAANNFTPTTIAGATTPPPTPVANSATADPSSPGDTSATVTVDWRPVTFAYPVLYQVEYWSGSGVSRPSQPPASQVVSGAPDGTTNCGGSSCLQFQVAGLTMGQFYNFDVVAISGSQPPSPPSNVVTTTTASPYTSACSWTSITISPTQPQVDSQGNPTNFTYLSVTVQASSTCTGLSVEYGLNDKNGKPQSPLTLVPLSFSNGTFNGQASQSTWQRGSTYGFVLYQNGTATTLQANVTPCYLNKGGQCN